MVILKVCELSVVLFGIMTERSQNNNCIWNGIDLEQNPAMIHCFIFAS